MNRRQLLATLIGVTAFNVTTKADAEVMFTGQFSATELESQEGYFGFGNEMAVVTRPNTTAHEQMRRFVGKEVVWVIKEI